VTHNVLHCIDIRNESDGARSGSNGGRRNSGAGKPCPLEQRRFGQRRVRGKYLSSRRVGSCPMGPSAEAARWTCASCLHVPPGPATTSLARGYRKYAIAVGPCSPSSGREKIPAPPFFIGYVDEHEHMISNLNTYIICFSIIYYISMKDKKRGPLKLYRTPTNRLF
jgi:hypothetical protein